MSQSPQATWSTLHICSRHSLHTMRYNRPLHTCTSYCWALPSNIFTELWQPEDIMQVSCCTYSIHVPTLVGETSGRAEWCRFESCLRQLVFFENECLGRVALCCVVLPWEYLGLYVCLGLSVCTPHVGKAVRSTEAHSVSSYTMD